MEKLSLNTFLTISSDFELNQFRILGGLKEFLNSFNKKKVYPSLSELIYLFKTLTDLLKQKNNISTLWHKRLKEFDLDKKQVVYEDIEFISHYEVILFELIQWAIPMIKNAIDEGTVLFDFVDKNLILEEIGVIPIYKNEGYIIFHNSDENEYQVHRFECSIFNAEDEPFRILKTSMMKNIPIESLESTPEKIKLELIKSYNELPNPATYLCEHEFDFPFDETVLPIAKRKLINKIAA